MENQEIDDLLRAKLAERQKAYEDIMKKAAPHRAKIDALLAESQKIDAEMEKHLQEWRPLNEQAAVLQGEIGKLARGLGGKSTSDAPRT